jgi:hypothetical protein
VTRAAAGAEGVCAVVSPTRVSARAHTHTRVHTHVHAATPPLRSPHPKYRTLLSPGASLAMPAVPAIGPGATPHTRTPQAPHSSASARVSASTAALAAHACAWYHVAP